MRAGELHDNEIDAPVGNVNMIGPVLRVMNALIEQRELEDYVIGGGVAVLYYSEPVLTYDFDLFCVFPSQQGLLLDPAPVFRALRQQGYLFGKEDRIMIEGIPVQLLPVTDGLVAEAVAHAAPITISGVSTKIFTIEYLIAMMLQLNRPKDRAKIDLLVHNESVAVNRDILHPLLTRFQLIKRWERVNDVD